MEERIATGGGIGVVEHGDCGAVLLVEDELRLRRTLVRSLEGRGYRVVEAATAGEAVTSALTASFAVMLLDVNLPDATGWDVLRQLRAAGCDVRVVVLSAVPPNPTRVREFRPLGVLYKPFPIDALLRLVRTACNAPAPQEVLQ